MATYLAEFYVASPQEDALPELRARVRAAVQEVSERGQRVRYLQSILLPEEETCFCLFSAGSGEAVAAVQARAGLVPTRIVAALTDAAEHPSA